MITKEGLFVSRFDSRHMEAGTKTKKTVYVGGLADDIDEAKLIETFGTFGMCEIDVAFL